MDQEPITSRGTLASGPLSCIGLQVALIGVSFLGRTRNVQSVEIGVSLLMIQRVYCFEVHELSPRLNLV